MRTLLLLLSTHLLHRPMSKQHPTRGLVASWSALDDDPVLVCGGTGCCDGLAAAR